ncbi:cryptochrome/photolyase family protein [Falsiroseomonas selenitidurans]|uniref:Cryptochrome/photolyase family protein n=1 Tax=Falsiroseomonas selenitidurans TaxID=2716335 RepID=A0ABX1EAH0_9PROT|nr:cryptochrome/photolyase family protein [Falsiroseomonas selenitidurans]NKC34219.1 cryptochrome/photolyase family protein [Falsiroseomonas selenitidurans]
MTALRLVLGDQCSHAIAALAGIDPARDLVLLAEVRSECTYVPHHKQKIALVLSAMRHFAAALAARGLRVRHVALDDPSNTQTLAGEVARAARDHGAARIICTHPGEWRVLQDMRGWQDATGLPVEIREDGRFLCSLDRFRAWAAGRRQLRMEYFYREMRRESGLLMQGPDEPAGGAWNYDAENRAALPAGTMPPTPRRFPPDALTQAVIGLVEREFPGHFGTTDRFAWPVTAEQARQALADFIAHRLPRFGDYQDAMAEGQPVLFHALIAAALNCGLLEPLEACRAAEAAYRQGAAPLNAVEGFIRQILGWREYVRGLYWLKMPDYRTGNALAATRPLPWLYWSGETAMACMAAAIGQTRDLAYAHHIQRLMVTGNFALLAGLDPAEVNHWYMVVYADAYEWVELPNVQGMALHADGGVMASKPYAASGAYINRMSDHCRGCAYDVKRATGPGACPFNFLYWDFVARHAQRFAGNPRMAMPLRTLARMDQAKVAAMRAEAASFLSALERGEAPAPPRAARPARRTSAPPAAPAMSLDLPEPSPARRRRPAGPR